MATVMTSVRAGVPGVEAHVALCASVVAFYAVVLVAPVPVWLAVPLVLALLGAHPGAVRVTSPSAALLAVSVAFVAAAGVSLSTGPTTAEEVRATLQFVTLPAVAAVFLVSGTGRSRHLLASMWCGSVIGTAVSAVVAIDQVVVLGASRAEGVRVNSIVFGDLVLLMGAMSLALCVLVDVRLFGPLGRALDERLGGRAVEVTSVASAGLGVLSSALSGSRGGWLAIPVLAALIAVHHRDALTRVHLRRGLAVAAGAAALAVVLTGGMPLQRAADAIGDVRGYAGAAPFESASGTTIGARLEAWRSAIGAFVQRPVLGVGWGNLQEHFRLDVARGDRHPRIAEFTHAHQQGLGALASGGVVGLAMLTALLAIPGRFFARAWSSADDVDRTVGLTGLLVIAAYVVFGLTEAIFESVVPLAFYAVSVGALVSQLTVERHRRVTAQPSSRAVTLTYEGRAPIATLPAPAGVLPRDRTRDARDRPRVAQHPTMVRTSRR